MGSDSRLRPPTGSPSGAFLPPAPGTTGSIIWRMLDPKTWELSNAPSAIASPPPSSASGALLPSNEQDAIRLAGEQRATQQAKLAGDTGNQSVGGMPADFTDPKVRRQTKRNYRALNRLLASSDPESGIGQSLLENLLRNGAITMTDTGASTALPYPGGQKANDRLVQFIDRYRDYLAGGGPSSTRSDAQILGILPPR